MGWLEMESVLTVTMNPTIDVSAHASHVIPDRKLRCKQVVYEPGGGGINVARVVQRLGGKTVALHASGGVLGRILRKMLDTEELKHIPVEIEGTTRESIMFVDDSTEQQFRFAFPGPELSESEWMACLDKIDSMDPAPKYAVFSGSLPQGVPDEFYGMAGEQCKKRGTRIVVDTPGTALIKAVQKGVYLIKPNIRELQDLVQAELSSEDEIKRAARDLIGNGEVEVVVVSLGAGGAFVVTADGTRRYESPTVPIKSKVGAGDSMVGGIVTRLSMGFEIDDAVRYGLCAGAAAVMTPGSELCHRDDVERLCGRYE